MNAAAKARSKVNPNSGNSLLVIWNTEAISMMAIIPEAATGVSIGLIRNIDGSNRPNAPRISDTPIKRTNHAGTSLAHGSDADNCSMGEVDFMMPAMINIPANNTWTTHKIIFRTFDFGTVFIKIYLTEVK
jgi:hypothetical protein